MRQDEAIGELDEIGSLERIDAAVDDRVAGQVLPVGFPAEELGVARQHDRASGRRAGSIGLFIGTHLLLEPAFQWGRGGGGWGLDGEHRQDRGQEQGDDGFHG